MAFDMKDSDVMNSLKKLEEELTAQLSRAKGNKTSKIYR